MKQQKTIGVEEVLSLPIQRKAKIEMLKHLGKTDAEIASMLPERGRRTVDIAAVAKLERGKSAFLRAVHGKKGDEKQTAASQYLEKAGVTGADQKRVLRNVGLFEEFARKVEEAFEAGKASK